MSEGGFLETRPRSPGGLAIVIAAHAAVLSALALSKMDTPVRDFLGPLEVRNIPLPQDPPPEPPPPTQKSQEVPQHKTVLTRTDPIVKTKSEPVYDVPKEDPVVLSWVDAKPGPIDIRPADPPPPPRPLPDPVRIEARLDPRSELLPPYPAEEQRAEREGSVTVRVVIGADGRVKRVDKVAAASEAFWRETQRHALRNWRFKPATVDGKAVETTKQMTVHFVLDG